MRPEWRHGNGFPNPVLKERVIKFPSPMAALGNFPMTPTDGAATRLKSRQNPTGEDMALVGFVMAQVRVMTAQARGIVASVEVMTTSVGVIMPLTSSMTAPVGAAMRTVEFITPLTGAVTPQVSFTMAIVESVTPQVCLVMAPVGFITALVCSATALWTAPAEQSVDGAFERARPV